MRQQTNRYNRLFSIFICMYKVHDNEIKRDGSIISSFQRKYFYFGSANQIIIFFKSNRIVFWLPRIKNNFLFDNHPHHMLQ